MINQLPEGVLSEILVRLPVKSLLQFSCVCKKWCALIKSPYFADMHLNHAKDYNDHRVVLIKRFIKDGKKTVLSFHSHHNGGEEDETLRVVAPNLELPWWDRYWVGLIGACNGIVCISDFYDIYLCNPARHELLKLPVRPFVYPDGCSKGSVFTTNGLAFGFDPPSGDYKVLRIISFSAGSFCLPSVTAEIYNLSTNSWRNLDADLPKIEHPHPCFPALIHGSYHWCAASTKSRLSVSRMILSFNICTEAFGQMEFPCYIADDTRPSLVVLDDSLAFISFKNPYPQRLPSIYEQFIDIWVMVEYGIKESWMKKFSLGPLVGMNGPLIHQPLCSWNNDKLLLQSEDGYLISCSLKNHSQETRKFDICGQRDTLKVIIYQESLVSLSKRHEGLSWWKI
ncbi:F-box/kelch-repeat protein At3g06240-like [Coffea eugenioides]|uniref:F-box/kelch-repeat protein At3g06240-like n=1 Tax=Coffea eugenioides TaxID=49369 RepID=UPI000F60A9C7|nr:F-box/kelch-repeat protein At3g06240-like [Coffea eugenioides]